MKIKRFFQLYVDWTSFVCGAIVGVLIPITFISAIKEFPPFSWEALGAISTTIAVVVALFQTHIQFCKKLNMSVNIMVKIKRLTSDETFDVLAFNVTNAGNVDVRIEQWGMYINKTYYVVPTYSQNMEIVEQKELPIILHPSEKECFLLTHKTFVDTLQGIYIPNKKKKLICYLSDSTGKTYYCKSKQNISEIMERLSIGQHKVIHSNDNK